MAPVPEHGERDFFEAAQLAPMFVVRPDGTKFDAKRPFWGDRGREEPSGNGAPGKVNTGVRSTNHIVPPSRKWPVRPQTASGQSCG